jgi:hypothetical protein
MPVLVDTRTVIILSTSLWDWSFEAKLSGESMFTIFFEVIFFIFSSSFSSFSNDVRGFLSLWDEGGGGGGGDVDESLLLHE